jgi:hypothetical protein
MNPHRLGEVLNEAQTRFFGDDSNRKRRPNSFRQSEELSSDNPFDRFGRHIGREWDKFAVNVVQEWDKVARNVGQLFGQQQQQPRQLVVQTADASILEHNGPADNNSSMNKEVEMENFINQEMEQDAYEHIRAYLEVAGPILADLENLFDEFNMDDPTKV